MRYRRRGEERWGRILGGKGGIGVRYRRRGKERRDGVGS